MSAVRNICPRCGVDLDHADSCDCDEAPWDAPYPKARIPALEALQKEEEDAWNK